MPNLGSSDTPVEGQSFGLPAGAELTEDANGNLAIADSGGNIVLVRDETTGEWQFENTDLTGINAIDASSINTESLSTERADITDTLPDGVAETQIGSKGGESDSKNYQFVSQYTEGVGTEAVLIFNIRPDTDDGFGGQLAFVMVAGRTSASSHFIDVLAFAGFGGDGAQVIGSSTRGSPDRSYAEVSNEIELSMASGTANVTAIGWGISSSTEGL